MHHMAARVRDHGFECDETGPSTPHHHTHLRAQVARVMTENHVLSSVDHPFLTTMYGVIQSPTHLHFIIKYCPGRMQG